MDTQLVIEVTTIIGIFLPVISDVKVRLVFLAVWVHPIHRRSSISLFLPSPDCDFWTEREFACLLGPVYEPTNPSNSVAQTGVVCPVTFGSKSSAAIEQTMSVFPRGRAGCQLDALSEFELLAYDRSVRLAQLIEASRFETRLILATTLLRKS
jgi:hypothetical protein